MLDGLGQADQEVVLMTKKQVTVMRMSPLCKFVAVKKDSVQICLKVFLLASYFILLSSKFRKIFDVWKVRLVKQ